MISKIKSQLDDEVDLLGVILTIWNNKFKVFFVAVAAAIAMLGFQTVVKHVPEYVATTEIRSISTFDELEYKTYNLYFTKTGPITKKPSSSFTEKARAEEETEIVFRRKKKKKNNLKQQPRKKRMTKKEIADKRISDYQKIVFSTLNNLKLNKLRQIFNGILELDDHLQNLARNCYVTLKDSQRIERQGRDLVDLTKVVAVRITELETKVDPVEEKLTIEPFSKPEF